MTYAFLMTTKQHYENHLSSFYSWMFGDFDEMVGRQKAFFEKFEIHPFSSTKVAIDLGSGSGFQSIALQQLGFDVHAVDFSENLLRELHQRNQSIKTHLGDIRDFAFMESLNPELIVCMGDTLSHLASRDEVSKLIMDSYAILPPGGRLVLIYRDLSGPRNELERFIPVRSDNDRILTCFLEDHGDSVRVFDLFHQKQQDGKSWTLHKSFYDKIKLPLELLVSQLQSVGFRPLLDRLPSGMEIIIGQK
jgi:SAM-dependent methyltransferase